MKLLQERDGGIKIARHVFRQALGATPHEHQQRAWDALAKGKSIVLRAPTGSGKTEAVFLPFATFVGGSLPARLLYALPLRSMANQVAERIQKYAERLNKERNWRVRLQHGESPESVLFAADAVVCTIDQLITSYACTPLVLPLRHGNIPAGAVMGSFVVFDEVHLFDPERALQAMRLICERLYRLGLPFALLSATLPDSVLYFWEKRFGCEIIDTQNEVVERSVRIEFEESKLSVEQVIEVMQEGYQRILVVTNTVERAVDLFGQVCSQVAANGYECQLLHSRFLPDDRKAKENWVTKKFGKGAKGGKSLLVATQVVEAGLDISADCVLTELAPIDALIQRAGRCTRWGGSGILRVFGVESSLPYDRELVRATKEVLERCLPTDLVWGQSKAWVNEVLDKYYKKVLQNDAYEQIVAWLSYAAFTGDRTKAEQAVRDMDTVEVTLHDQPERLGKEVLRLPTISVHVGVVRSWLGKGAQAWRIKVDEDPSDATLRIQIVPANKGRIFVGDRIVLSPLMLFYDSELGLQFGQNGKSFEPLLAKERRKPEIPPRRETWVEHAVNTVRWVEKLFCDEHHAARGLARLLNVSLDEVKLATMAIALLHDFGKLTVQWQCRAGIGENTDACELLARTADCDHEAFPPHATISAMALWEALQGTFQSLLGEDIVKAMIFAIAHHHSVRAQQVPRYKLHRSWREAVEQAMSQVDLRIELDGVFEKQESLTCLREKFPPIERERLYITYVLLARWLRLADRMAAEGSEDAILCYEDWFGQL